MQTFPKDFNSQVPIKNSHRTVVNLAQKNDIYPLHPHPLNQKENCT
ncbi:hypothetical protein Lbys_1644 [Leadbetterella byssophila DSM 17132]|uniref:Uncharacterized protein n=1 Tax=Leadbetterella byssophila (strain DSM 17132 / JCM 16389 / KACC 11308 / NBRC 106382 / 4M15) TaxID=649349 RepID=E4RYV5_LEAB4|nr:hypothetical protein Lbys_1644 [Leadbetterella byssophila DSM 17132]